MKEGLLVGFLSVWLGCWVISIFSVLFTKEASHMHLDGVVMYLIKYIGYRFDDLLAILFACFLFLTTILSVVVIFVTLPIWYFLDWVGFVVY